MRHLAITVSIALSLAIADPALAQSVTLAEGTTIRLETRHEVSSKSARVGDQVEFAVAQPVLVNNVTVIPAGTPAVGEVVKVRDNGLLGRSGKLDIRVSKVNVGQQQVPVRGQRNAKGKSGTLGAVGAGVVFLPLAIIVRGQEAKIRAGTSFEVYVDQDIPFPGTAELPAEHSASAPPDTASPM